MIFFHQIPLFIDTGDYACHLVIVKNELLPIMCEEKKATVKIGILFLENEKIKFTL